MKKLFLLLMSLTLLCSCGSGNSTSTSGSSAAIPYARYSERGINEDGYYYLFEIAYEKDGSLVISRTKELTASYKEYKTFPFGKYEYIILGVNYPNRTSDIYDYGDYAVWVKKL